ncbi:MAG: cytochrome c [Pseudorhodobacter sp.]|nr:cytochrome c [Pseudorhodobacter sp.]
MQAGVDIARGARLYGEACASCHGDKLQGQPDWQTPGADGIYPAPPHDESGHTWHHSDAVLFEYVRLGGAQALAAQGVTGFASGMPAFGSRLSDRETRDILAFIKSQWPKRARAAQAARSAAP